MAIRGNSRRYFRAITVSATEIKVGRTIVPVRADHYVRLLGYRVVPIIDDITYSTTAVWDIDAVLSPIREGWQDWTLDNAGPPPVDAPPFTNLIDSWRWSFESKVVTTGANMIIRTIQEPPVYCDLALPAVFLAGRRWGGADQTYGLMGWVDFEWVKGTSAEMAAVNLAWSKQGVPQT